MNAIPCHENPGEGAEISPVVHLVNSERTTTRTLCGLKAGRLVRFVPIRRWGSWDQEWCGECGRSLVRKPGSGGDRSPPTPPDEAEQEPGYTVVPRLETPPPAASLPTQPPEIVVEAREKNGLTADQEREIFVRILGLQSPANVGRDYGVSRFEALEIFRRLRRRQNKIDRIDGEGQADTPGSPEPIGAGEAGRDV